MLHRVKYVSPPFLKKNKNINIRLLKWYSNYSNWLNSHVICRNSLFNTDTDVC